jgi:hypothetical protein
MIHHLLGKQNSRADILSRRPGFDQGVNDNKNIILLKPTPFSEIHIWAIQTNSPTYELPMSEFLPQVRRASKNLDKVVKALQTQEAGWTRADGVHLFRNHIYVPVNRNLREEIVREHHDSPLVGHPGHHKTAELILREYWWPSIHRDVHRYVTGCDVCQCTKPHRVPAKTPLHPFDPPS